MRILLTTALSRPKLYTGTSVPLLFHCYHFTKILALGTSLYFLTHLFRGHHHGIHVFLTTFLHFADGIYRFYVKYLLLHFYRNHNRLSTFTPQKMDRIRKSLFTKRVFNFILLPTSLLVLTWPSSRSFCRWAPTITIYQALFLTNISPPQMKSNFY